MVNFWKRMTPQKDRNKARSGTHEISPCVLRGIANINWSLHEKNRYTPRYPAEGRRCFRNSYRRRLQSFRNVASLFSGKHRRGCRCQNRDWFHGIVRRLFNRGILQSTWRLYSAALSFFDQTRARPSHFQGWKKDLDFPTGSSRVDLEDGSYDCRRPPHGCIVELTRGQIDHGEHQTIPARR